MPMDKNRKSKSHPSTILWLDERELHLYQSDSSDISKVEPQRSVVWNTNNTSILTPAGQAALSNALAELIKTAGGQRTPVRLCLGDSFCVTRVSTGEPLRVQRELEDIQSRSQLYLSLGLGEKLTGQIRVSMGNANVYALTTIVNQRVFQQVYNACRQASIKLTSVEPVTLAVTRAMGLLGTDAAQPVLQITMDDNRCDVSISRQGRLMLSYRVGGWKSMDAAADLVTSHMARLKRFCERYRLVENARLEQVYLFGKPEFVSVFEEKLRSHDEKLKINSNAANILSEPARVSAVVRLAMIGGSVLDTNDPSLLPPPDLLERLEEQQPSSPFQRYASAFWPSAVAAAAMIAMFLFNVMQKNRLEATKTFLSELALQVSDAEKELAEEEKKQEWLRRMQAVDQTIQRNDWRDLTHLSAKCLPDNAKLESITLTESRKLSLKGTMADEDRSYEIISSLKRLPMIEKVSVESISSLDVRGANQMQFDVRCEIAKKTKNEQELKTAKLVRKPTNQLHSTD